MHGLRPFNHFGAGDRVGDLVHGDTSHPTNLSRITVHYAGRPFVRVAFVQGTKEGFLDRLKKAFLTRRKRPIRGIF